MVQSGDLHFHNVEKNLSNTYCNHIDDPISDLVHKKLALEKADCHTDEDSCQSEAEPEPELDEHIPHSFDAHECTKVNGTTRLILLSLSATALALCGISFAGYLILPQHSRLGDATSAYSRDDALDAVTALEVADREQLQDRAQQDLTQNTVQSDLGASASDAAIVTPLFRIPLEREDMPWGIAGEQFKSAYFGTLSVGTPPVEFKLVFDTGSGHLILPSAYCKSETCRSHRRYRRSKSSTGRDIEASGADVVPNQPRDQITVTFGTGEVTGVFVEDNLCWSHDQHRTDAASEDNGKHSVSTSALGCVAIRMVAATDMSEDPFRMFTFDGIMGLGLPALSQTPAFNFLNVVRALTEDTTSGASSVFSIFLSDSKVKASELTFGGWAEEHMAGPLMWNSVYEPQLGHWLVEVKALRIGDEVLDFCEQGCRAVVDSGTSLLAVPTLAFPELYSRLKHPAPLSGDCEGPGPLMHLDLENVTITLGPKEYSRLEQSPLPSLNPFEDSNSFSNSTDRWPVRRDMHCKPLLMSMHLPAPIGPKVFVLGEPVLRKYYTVYDGKEERIGFAEAWQPRASVGQEPTRSSIFHTFRSRKARR